MTAETQKLRNLQDALDYACAQGRVEGGWDIIHRLRGPARNYEPAAPVEARGIHLNGGGLDGVKRDAFYAAHQKAGGNKDAIARMLKVSPTTVWSMARRYAVKPKLINSKLGSGILLCGFLSFGFTVMADPPLPPIPKVRKSAAGAALVAPVVTKVSLAWDASPDSSVTGYRVYWGVASGNYTNSASVGNGTTATLTGLAPGATYWFAATAYDSVGGESPFSNEVTSTTPGDGGGGGGQLPALTLRTYAFLLECRLVAGRTNNIQSSTNQTTWQTEWRFLGTNGTFTSLVTNNQPQKYFRVTTE